MLPYWPLRKTDVLYVCVRLHECTYVQTTSSWIFTNWSIVRWSIVIIFIRAPYLAREENRFATTIAYRAQTLYRISHTKENIYLETDFLTNFNGVFFIERKFFLWKKLFICCSLFPVSSAKFLDKRISNQMIIKVKLICN